MFASGFSWFHLLPGLEMEKGQHVFGFIPVETEGHLVYMAWMISLALCVFAVVARMSLGGVLNKQGIEKFYSDDRLTVRALAEVLVGGIWGLVREVLGDEKYARAFTPFIGVLFTYILVSNLSAVVPGFAPPTDNINNNIGMALTVFVVFNAVGLYLDPKGYILHLWGPVNMIGPLLFTIEVVGLCIRPMSLTLRLAGNIYGDHMVFSIISDLVPVFIPAIFLGVAMFVSFIQAYVFSLLTTIYIGMSIPHHDHEHGDDHAHDDAHAHH